METLKYGNSRGIREFWEGAEKRVAGEKELGEFAGTFCCVEEVTDGCRPKDGRPAIGD